MSTSQHLDILGYPVRDKITGAGGIAVSVSFDLYGCIQVVVNRGFDKDGKRLDSEWFDIVRLPDAQRAYQSRLKRKRFLLRGRNLACWCPLDAPCHADVLLYLVNDLPRPATLPGFEPLQRIA